MIELLLTCMLTRAAVVKRGRGEWEYLFWVDDGFKSTLESVPR